MVSSIGFSSILVLAAFIGSTANEFTRGTLRVAFTRTSRRLSLLVGKVVARMGVATGVMLGGAGRRLGDGDAGGAGIRRVDRRLVRVGGVRPSG